MARDYDRWTRIKRTVRYWYLRVLRTRASAHSIALGCGLGVFVGFLPIIPFQSVTVLALAFVFRASKLPAWLGTFISNPFNMIPFYLMLFVVGRFFLGLMGLEFDQQMFSLAYVKSHLFSNPDGLSMKDMIQYGWRFFLVMMFGGVVAGIPSAAAAYLASLYVVRRYRRRRALRLLRRRSSR
ncbi:MAG: DUF2062 domain-containing protein [Desulfovibrionaceae bacterium]|nr:DUF2062 domain-containing protein [Desulfovibrionaceae bacterium]